MICRACAGLHAIGPSTFRQDSASHRGTGKAVEGTLFLLQAGAVGLFVRGTYGV